MAARRSAVLMACVGLCSDILRGGGFGILLFDRRKAFIGVGCVYGCNTSE